MAINPSLCIHVARQSRMGPLRLVLRGRDQFIGVYRLDYSKGARRMDAFGLISRGNFEGARQCDPSPGCAGQPRRPSLTCDFAWNSTRAAR